MSSSHMRELVMYRRRSDGLFAKTRCAVPTFNEPRASREVFTGSESLYCLLGVFAPDETFALVWGLIMITTVLYQVITVPFFLAFEADDTYGTLMLDFLCTLIYFSDILVTCNTSFYRKGILIENRAAIFARYMKTWLVLDVISSFPYTWLLQSPFELSSASNYKAPSLIKVVKVSRMLRTFRLVRVAKIRQYLTLLEQKMSSKLSILFTMLWLTLMMVCIAHWAACGFYYMSQLDDTVDDWVFTFNMENSPNMDKYITALYWAITTLTTTGYGDIVPVSTTERIYGIIVMIVSAAVFSYLIGKVGTVIALLEKESTEHKELIMDASRSFKNAEVPADVACRALRYLDYVHDSRNRRKVLDTSILRQFSEPLKNEISDHIFGKVLLRVPALVLFHREFISQLARSVQPEIFAQDDVLFEGAQLSSCVFFLEKGNVEMFHKPSAHTFAVLSVRRSQPGQHFGEVAFFTGRPRSASARCLQFCEVLSLSRDSILDLIKLSPDANYTFQQINNHFQARNYSEVGLACYFCRSAAHLAFECENAQLHIEKEAIAQKWLRKRNAVDRVIQQDGTTTPNFRRKAKKVQQLKHYSVNNVKSQGWKRIKGWGYGLTKAVEKTRESVIFSLEEATVIAKGDKDDLEFCPLEVSERLHPASVRGRLPSDDESCPSPPRRYSMIAGVKAYPLSDELKHAHLDTQAVLEEAISEGSEEFENDEKMDF